MMTAKLFENGRSQAVRLPKEYRFQGDEVLVNKIGDVVLLMPKSGVLSTWIRLTGAFISIRDIMPEGEAV